MTEEKKQRNHDMAPFVVGTWNEGGTVFTAAAHQPPTPITDFGKIVAWAKEAFAKVPGKYEFVRKLGPEKRLTLAEQTTMKAVLG